MALGVRLDQRILLVLVYVSDVLVLVRLLQLGVLVGCSSLWEWHGRVARSLADWGSFVVLLNWLLDRSELVLFALLKDERRDVALLVRNFMLGIVIPHHFFLRMSFEHLLVNSSVF